MGECSGSNVSDLAHFRKATLAQKLKQATSGLQSQLKYHDWQPQLTQLQNQGARDSPGALEGIKIVT